MIGRVRLKSNRAAFSIASEGGAKASEKEVAVAPSRVADLSFEIWCLSFWLMVSGILGSEIWSMGSLGVGERAVVGTRIMGFEEAIIALAMATAIWRIRMLVECVSRLAHSLW